MSDRLDPRYLPLHRMLRIRHVVRVNLMYRGKLWPIAVSEKDGERVVYVRAWTEGEGNIQTCYRTDGNVTIEAPFDFITTVKIQEMILGNLVDSPEDLTAVPPGVAARILGMSRRKIKRMRRDENV